MTATRIIEHASGIRLAAGLAWRNVPPGLRAAMPGSPTGLSMVPGEPGCVLRIGDRCARTEAQAPAEGAGSLLVAMALGLVAGKDAGRVRPGPWLFAAELPVADGEPGHWLGQVMLSQEDEGDPFEIQPVPGPEELHPDRESFLSALADIAAVTTLAGVAVGGPTARARGALAKEARALVAGQGDAGDRSSLAVLVAEPDPSAGPMFVRQKAVPRRVFALGVVAAAAGIAALLVLPAAMSSLFRAPPPPPPEMVAAAPAPGAFAAACTSALADWWPRIAGWEAVERGCALAESLPRSGAPTRADLSGDIAGEDPALPLAAWLRLEPVPGANPVLAEHAARRVLAGWRYGRRDTGEALLLWKVRALPLHPVPEGDRSPAPDRVRIMAELSALWAHLPTAVADGDEGIVVTAPGNASALLARAGRVDGVVPARLVLEAKEPARLTLKARAPRRVPMDLFGALASEGAPLPALAAAKEGN